MAVCNGAAWLEQQVATIDTQSLRPQRLLVLNDASSDGSGTLLARLEATHGGWLQQLPPAPRRRGCVASFAHLLEATTAPYVALADQDDLWDPGKLEASLAVLLAAEERAGQRGSAQPLLVHSDARLIDGEGQMLHPSWWQRQGLAAPPRDLWHLAARNRVMGCTALLNRACLEAALPIPPEAILHDWWLALVAEQAGGLLQLPQATLSYRCHSANLSRPARWWQWPQRAWAVWHQWGALQRRFGKPVRGGDGWRLVQRRVVGGFRRPGKVSNGEVAPPR